MKILRVITRLNIGGAAIQAVTLNEKLYPHDICLLYGSVSDNEGSLEGELCINSCKIKQLKRTIGFHDFTAFWQIRKFIKDFKPDIVHTHTSKAGFLVRFAILTLWKKPKVIHTFHGHVFHSYFSKLKTFIIKDIEKFLAKYTTDKIIAISSIVAQDLIYKYKIACVHIFTIFPDKKSLSPENLIQ